MDECRIKSKNLQGGVSGLMKRYIAKLKDVVITLVGKAEAVGDPSFLRVKMDELSKELKRVQKDNSKIKKALDESKKRIQELEDQARKKKEDVTHGVPASLDVPMETESEGGGVPEDAYVIAHRVLREHNLSPMPALERLVRRPSIQGVASMIPEPPVEDMVVLTDLSRREKELTSQVDALIKARGSVREDIIKINNMPKVMDSASSVVDIPRRDTFCGPVIVSDVQIVRPRHKLAVAGTSSGHVLTRGSTYTAGGVSAAFAPAHVAVGDADDSWLHPVGSRRRRKRKGSRLDDKFSYNNTENVAVQPAPPLQQRRQQRPTTYAERAGALTEGAASRPVADNMRSGDVPAALLGGASVALTRSARRLPRTAVVNIKCVESAPSYAELLRTARERVNLSDVGITDSRIRWSAGGSILIEIPGLGKNEKAELLADRLKEALAGYATVSRPVVGGELRLWGLDVSISAEDVIHTVSGRGGCSPVEVRPGPFVKMPNGLHSVWVRCPLEAAIKASSGGKIRIGWSTVRVELLQARPMQCFKCWQYGHVSAKCKIAEDRSRSCFKCSLIGHLARDCGASVPLCLVCRGAGRSALHRMGASGCGAAAAAKLRNNRTRIRSARGSIASSSVPPDRSDPANFARQDVPGAFRRDA